MLKILAAQELPQDGPVAPVARSPRHAGSVTVYCDPGAVLADLRLTPGERRRVLEDWAQDIADRDIARSEEGTEPLPAHDEALLRQVNDALAQLEEQELQSPFLQLLRRLLGSD